MPQPPVGKQADIPQLTDFQKGVLDDIMTRIRNDKRPEMPQTKAAMEARGPSTVGAGSGPLSGPVAPHVSPVVSPEGLTPSMRREMMTEIQRRILAGEIKSPDEVRAPGSIQQTTEGTVVFGDNTTTARDYKDVQRAVHSVH